MGPMKRPAAAVAVHGSGGKRSRSDPVASDCVEVANLIGEANGYPQEVLGMLSNAVKDSLSDAKETRHAFQGRVIGMLGDILATVDRDARARTAELEGKLASADSEKMAREQAIEAAVADVVEKTKELEVAKAAHNEAVSEVQKARKEKSLAEEAQVAGDKAYNGAADKKAKLEAMLDGDYNDMRQGTQTGARVFNRFQKFSKDFDFDENLVTSAQKTFNTAASARGSFDEMVVKQLDDAFAAAIHAQADILASGETGKVERENAVQRAIRLCNVAVEHETVKGEQVKAAHEALNAAHAHKKATDKALKEFGPEMKQVSNELSKAQGKQNSVAAVLDKFHHLVSRSEEPEPVEATA